MIPAMKKVNQGGFGFERKRFAITDADYYQGEE
jgi:hypothetical protein